MLNPDHGGNHIFRTDIFFSRYTINEGIFIAMVRCHRAVGTGVGISGGIVVLAHG